MGIKGYKHPGKKRAVVAVNPDGSVAGYFEYIKDAVAKYGMNRHSVTNSCRRGTICRGLKWFYEEDFRRIYESGEFEKLKYTLDPNRDRMTYHFKKGHKANLGIYWTDERRRKRAEDIKVVIKRRIENGAYKEAAKKLHKEVINIDDGTVFPSVKAAAEYYGIPRNTISMCMHNFGKVRGMRLRLKSLWDSTDISG